MDKNYRILGFMQGTLEFGQDLIWITHDIKNLPKYCGSANYLEKKEYINKIIGNCNLEFGDCRHVLSGHFHKPYLNYHNKNISIVLNAFNPLLIEIAVKNGNITEMNVLPIIIHNNAFISSKYKTPLLMSKIKIWDRIYLSFFYLLSYNY